MRPASSRYAERNAQIYTALRNGARPEEVGKLYGIKATTVKNIERKVAQMYRASGAPASAVKQAIGDTESVMIGIAGSMPAPVGSSVTPEKPSLLNEVGLSGLKYSAGYLYEEFLNELRMPWSKYKVFNEMRFNSPVVAAILLAVELTIRRIDWHVEGDDDRADFIEGAWGDMSHTWGSHLSQVLTMLPFGWAWFEVVYKRRGGEDGDPASQFGDGKIGWRKLAFRSQDSLLRWNFDNTGGVQHMLQRTYPDFQIHTIPMAKSILYRTKIEKDNPEGFSMLRPAYVPYYYIKNLQGIEAISAERDLAGLPMVKLPQGTDTSSGSTDFTNAQNIVGRVRQDQQAGLVIPFGWEFDLLSSPGSKQIKIHEIIERHEKRMAMSLLAQFLLLGMSERGSYALAKDHSDFFVMAVTTWADSIADTFNRYAVNKLLRLNGMSTINGPKLAHGPLGTPDLTALGGFISNIGLGGFLKPDVDLEEWLRNIADMPAIPEHEIEVREAQEEKAVSETGTKEQQPAPPSKPGDNLDGMSLKRQIEAFRASGNGHHNGNSGGLEKRVKARAKTAQALMDKQAQRGLKRLKDIPAEEWDKAVKHDINRETENVK